jgi:aminopeptidase N
MRKNFVVYASLCCFVVLQSCALLGVHLNPHNPRKQKPYPKFSKETILLGELTPVRSNFDVRHYDLRVLFQPQNKHIGGWVGILSTAKATIDSIQLDLDQNLAIEEIRWNSQDGSVLKYRRVERAVFIRLPELVKSGNNFKVWVKYGGNPVSARKPPWAGGVVWKVDKNGKYWSGVACETEGASVWFPCKDHTSDEPDSVDLHYSLKFLPGLMVVGNGRLLDTLSNAGLQTYHWKVSCPINLYDVTFYIGDFVPIHDSMVGINGQKLELNHYVLRHHVETAQKHFEKVKYYIEVYEALYGPYPWYADGFKLVESPYAGMEHQTAIAYGNKFKNDLNGLDDYILLHETGHEWFGNAITASDLADVWLQEGFTTYGESLFMERAYGKQAMFNHLYYSYISIKNKWPMVGPKGRRFFDYHDGDVYSKGAQFLHTLRSTIQNDSLFFKCIRQFYMKHRYGVCESADFLKVVNEVCAKDFTWLFNQYLYDRKVPVLEYFFQGNGTFLARFNFVKADFNQLPVKIIIYTSEGAMETTIYPSSKIKSFKINGLDRSHVFQGMRLERNVALFGVEENKALDILYLQGLGL